MSNPVWKMTVDFADDRPRQQVPTFASLQLDTAIEDGLDQLMLGTETTGSYQITITSVPQ